MQTLRDGTEGAMSRSKKLTYATLGPYHTYFSTGMIPYNPKRPSKKAQLFMKFFGLSGFLPKKKINDDKSD